MVARERARLLEGLRALELQVAASQANVLWLRADGVDGGELARRLERHGVIVAPGGPLGDAAFVRAAVQRPEAGDRLLRALELSGRR
jgi:histidinol-phosphate/aromatic aminotransferase/cobyric acid decarboxylase-like protein